MELKQTLWNSFILIRPYSLMNIVAIVLLTNVFLFNKLIVGFELFVNILIGLLVWISVVYLLEIFHKKVDHRRSIPLILFLISILSLFFLIHSNLNAILVLILLLLFDLIYSSKVKDWFLSSFVFIFRGSAEIGLIFILIFLNNQSPLNEKFFPLLLSVYFITISRNLVGDIRDIYRDKFTFPKKFGLNLSYLLSSLFLIIVIIYLFNPLLIYPLIPVLFTLFLRLDAYFIHSFYVLSTLFFLINYLFFLTGFNWIFFLVLFIGVLFLFTYNLVPRKAEKDLECV